MRSQSNISGSCALSPCAVLPSPALGGGQALDPVENISTERLSGHYRRQYLAEATGGVWGTRDSSGCGRMSMVRLGERVCLHPVLCDTWSCRLCGVKRAAWLKRQLQRVQVDYGLTTFVTLTIRTTRPASGPWLAGVVPPPRAVVEPWESFPLAKQSWNRLRLALRRRYGPFSYVWTVEATKRGYAHLHLLMSIAPQAAVLSDLWFQATGNSWVVDVQPVDSTRAADYLAKYCTQQASQRALGERSRFFSKSRDVVFDSFRPVSDAPDAWTIVSAPYWSVRGALCELGLSLVKDQLQGSPSCVALDPRGLAAKLLPAQPAEVPRPGAPRCSVRVGLASVP